MSIDTIRVAEGEPEAKESLIPSGGTFSLPEKGAYRVEAYRRYLFKKRGWVFTNPIYLL